MKKFFERVSEFLSIGAVDDRFSLSEAAQAAYDMHGLGGLVAQVYAHALSEEASCTYGVTPCPRDLFDKARNFYEDYKEGILKKEHEHIVKKVREMCEYAALRDEIFALAVKDAALHAADFLSGKLLPFKHEPNALGQEFFIASREYYEWVLGDVLTAEQKKILGSSDTHRIPLGYAVWLRRLLKLWRQHGR